MALVAPVAALWWTAVLLLVPAQARPPVGAITLEATTTAALALTAATIALRFTDEPEPRPSVAAALLTLAVLAPTLLPARWDLFVTPGDPAWGPAHTGWAVLLGCAVLLWVLCGPEPLRRLGSGRGAGEGQRVRVGPGAAPRDAGL
ncbi:hypothetical protein AB0I51_40760 [Streptomyces sp. NPDC050549]|uniref:hypothetical protein n=1 Tax=Streptomyces sp. NPDC050549 TaxID=3155406 RepID=UPI003422666B